MARATDVIEVFRTISDCGGPWLLTPSGLTYQTVENTFSGEVIRQLLFFYGGKMRVGEIGGFC